LWPKKFLGIGISAEFCFVLDGEEKFLVPVIWNFVFPPTPYALAAILDSKK